MYLYAKNTKTITLFKPPPHHPIAILESIHWTQTAYGVLCQAAPCGYAIYVDYALIWMKTAYPHGAA